MRSTHYASANFTRLSLRRRMLAILLIPLLVILVLASLLAYSGALIYSNRIHDKDLANSALTLAQMMGSADLDGALSPQARFLLEYDPEGRSYYSVDSAKHGQLLGNASLAPADTPVSVGEEPVLYDLRKNHRPLRGAMMKMASANDPTDTLTITVAETLRDRRQRAREILFLTLPLQALLIVAVLSLVWFGVGYGLRVLDPLTARLSRREHDLSPIGEADVPVEILPLTRTIDALFARLRGVMSLQERFIADAAHQLRTPLTGLRMHVERARADPRPETMEDAFAHIQRLSVRAARTSAQLLSLTRAQSPQTDDAPLRPIDLATLIPNAIGHRVHDALVAGADLGYEGTPGPIMVKGDALLLQEMLDNLIDNSLHYAGRNHVITVGLRVNEQGNAILCIEDDGLGVPEPYLQRLGERFFRVPGATEGGTGLGLAIVERIADLHDATVHFSNGSVGGLRVEISFPAATKGF
jgi:two-component system sensor histidine kinase TctE